jgi:hypothetical protein
MKKSTSVTLGAVLVGTFLLLTSSNATLAQSTGNQVCMQVVNSAQVQALPNVFSLVSVLGGGFAPSTLCNTTGGVLLAVMDAVKAGTASLYCQCPAGTKFYQPAGGCVKPGVGAPGSPGSTPPKKQN